MIAALLEAQIDTKTLNLCTHIAAKSDNNEAVIALCEAGANPRLDKSPFNDGSLSDEMKTLTMDHRSNEWCSAALLINREERL